MTESQAPPPLLVKVEGGPEVRVALVGELDLATVELLEVALAPVFDEVPERLVFDLALLEFMDSSGIAVMLRAAAVVPTVRLENTPPMIRRILDATGLAEILPFD